MKQLTIIPKNKAYSLLSTINTEAAVCYYLSDDYSCFNELQDKLYEKVMLKNLSGIYDKTFNEIKNSILELITQINKKHNSIEWWGGQIASKNSGATPLLSHITYLFCIKKILIMLYIVTILTPCQLD